MTTLLEKFYEQDYYLWLMKNVALVREGRFSEADFGNIAEELESMGKSEKRALGSRLAVLLSHLLKWRFEPERRSNSWKYTIIEQRRKIRELLSDSPSLRHELDKKFAYAYESALIKAAKETGMDMASFPQNCPFSLKEVMDKSFFGDTD
ncbi:MAG: DUF29 domain-containing protein [Deltaproteobacteria bacterium]|nr:MAG: DUF29 domain-containing protein [Deltaproteobacteria bacterium]